MISSDWKISTVELKKADTDIIGYADEMTPHWILPDLPLTNLLLLNPVLLNLLLPNLLLPNLLLPHRTTALSAHDAGVGGIAHFPPLLADIFSDSRSPFGER